MAPQTKASAELEDMRAAASVKAKYLIRQGQPWFEIVPELKRLYNLQYFDAYGIWQRAEQAEREKS